jgi:C-terminal processing protease CtpA/Prc
MRQSLSASSFAVTGRTGRDTGADAPRSDGQAMGTRFSLTFTPSMCRAGARLPRVEAVIAGTTLFALGLVTGQAQLSAPTSTHDMDAAASPREFAIIRDAWDLLHERYVDPDALDSVQMARDAIRAMTEAVGDTGHTSYLDPDEAAALEAELAKDDRGLFDLPVAGSTAVPGTSLRFVELLSFPDGAADSVGDALEAAESDGATGLILDLRGNGGGLLEEAAEVVGLFVADGDAWQARNRDGTMDTRPVSPGATPTDLPLVVLVNADTASAAEVVAGALQDHGRATVVGVTTAGEGTILLGWVLDDGSELWIGESEWRTPNGRVVWEVGLAPDVEVDLPAGAAPLWARDLARMSASELAASGDLQLLRAIELVDSQGPPGATDGVDDVTAGADPAAHATPFALALFAIFGSVIAREAVREFRVDGPRYR